MQVKLITFSVAKKDIKEARSYFARIGADLTAHFISYPVMQSIDSPDFYLKHAFDKSYSNYGIPYIDEACATGLSNNIIIYGHNMSNGPMFADLLKYASQGYYDAHPVICFDTLNQLSQY